MPPKQPRADELEFREQVLRELASIRDYFDRERGVLLKEITDLRAQLAAATRAERDPVTASE